MISVVLASLLQAISPAQIDQNHPSDNPVRLVNGGFCVGLAWITLKPGEIVTVDNGPDFRVYRVHGPGAAEWGSYSGFAGQSRPDRSRALLTRSGVTVYRGRDDRKKFDGYFVGDPHQQNHFFGTMFKDTPSDAVFFDRAEFGAGARSKCEEYWRE